MSETLVTKVNNLAEAVGLDQKRQDAFLAKIAPANAESLTGKNLSMSGTSKKSGYLASNPEGNFKAGQNAGDLINYLINDPSFTLSTPDTATAVNYGDEGSLEAYINGTLVDTFDLAAVFDETESEGAQTYAPANGANGKITVTTVESYESIWQKLNARMNIVGSDLQSGYNSLVLKHVGTGEGDQVSATYEVFYDDADTTPSISGLTLDIDSETPKHLSGVKYLGKNSTVKVGVSAAHIADNSYVNNPLDFYSLRGVGTTTVSPTDSSVSGLSVPPAAGETMTVTGKVITLSSANQCDADGRIVARPRDPFGTYSTLTSASQKLLISTSGIRSTNTAEQFDDENHRLPLTWNSDDKTSALTGQWDSALALGSGDAQQYISADNEHSLMYPSVNFTSYKPANTVNYAGQSGAQKYLRCIVGSSASSSIQLVLAGVGGGIGQVGGGDVNIEIKLPGETGWLDCAKAYNGSSVANDGDGCLVGSIAYSGGDATVNATFGAKSSFGANYRCYIRITLNNGTRFVKSIVTNW